MDLNALYHRHQVSLMRANAAGASTHRTRHNADAAGIARCIGRLQRQAGAEAANGWLAAGTRL